MSINNPLRLQATIISIIICALFVNALMLAQNIIFPDRIERRQNILPYEKKFIALRNFLPQRGILGFITDVTKDDVWEDEDMRILTAQYSLAPIILVHTLNYPLIVGHFRNPSPDLEAYRNKGLIPLRDFGNGVILFKSEFR